jgi:hypothetical protein
MFYTPVARFATRPGGPGMECLTEFDTCTPDLIMGTLMKGGAHLLKSNCIYELVLNELTGVLELIEKGEANINKRWGHEYADIPHQLGARMWLTKDELKELDKQNDNIDL